MASYKIKWYTNFYLVLAFYTNFVLTSGDCKDLYQQQLLRSTASAMVVESTNPSQVQLQVFLSTAQQLWSFQRGSRAGLFYILHESSGMVLDINICDSEGQSCTLKLTSLNPNNRQQQWFINKDGTIANSFNLMNLEVQGGIYAKGTPIVISNPNGLLQQQFTLQDRSQ
ncbi:uncharacterized protein LOC135135163 [Zophobas morio]|uniref:uncharacterized protein LOC135135163 n=1 Tax=Zophobas morio TaxID=2755281 RepID=UPI003083A417